MTNVEALKELYVALGGDAAHVANAMTIVDVLNAIAAKFDGADNAEVKSDAIVNVSKIVDEINKATLVEKSVTANGTYSATDDQADGYSEVSVNVPANVTTKIITANGTYTASSDNADGYSEVIVNVPTSSD